MSHHAESYSAFSKELSNKIIDDSKLVSKDQDAAAAALGQDSRILAGEDKQNRQAVLSQIRDYNEHASKSAQCLPHIAISFDQEHRTGAHPTVEIHAAYNCVVESSVGVSSNGSGSAGGGSISPEAYMKSKSHRK